VNRILADNVFVTFPSWKQYCLGLDLATSTLSFSINGNITLNGVSVPNLSTAASIILNCKLVITSEMFSYVNIHSLALTKVDPTAVGSALAWQASDWSYPATTSSPLTRLAKTEVLGKEAPRLVIVPAVLAFNDALTTCTILGQGTLPDPVDLVDWKGLLNASAILLGQTDQSSLDAWIPYTAKTPNSNSSGYTSIYVPGKVMNSLLWSAGQPSPGEACAHCSPAGCQDDPCDLELPIHLCRFTAGKPMLQLRGLCKKSQIGKHYQSS
jgi:hypothetical protein